MTISTRITPALDRIESSLPLIPRRIFRLQRTLAEAGFSIGKSMLSVLGSSTDRVERSARSGAATVKGQAKAEAKQTVDLTEDEASSALGRATRAVEGESTDRLEDWSKDDLYARAQELDIDGRSTMSKKELVSALRSY